MVFNIKIRALLRLAVQPIVNSNIEEVQCGDASLSDSKVGKEGV